MAKINHHNFVDTVNDMLTEAKKRGVIQLEYTGNDWKGNSMMVNQHEMRNFGTCGYLGLEIHPQLIDKSMEYARNFGTQFSVSRAYLTSKSNFLLEEMLSEVFAQKKVISFTSTTMAHSAILPILLDHNDLIILDQQCHVSIQTAVQLLVAKGVQVELIRHSNLEMLEHKIVQNRDKYKRIWYMIDGVYSMYGDVAPMAEINQLMKRYPQLYLYIDDAHGMSWYGERGSGRVFAESCENQRSIYVSTMAKGFGGMGGVVVFPDETYYNKVILHGGPLAYSHPIPPPMMGAALASAEIHLSGEIYGLQNDLKKRIEYTNQLLDKTNLPIMSFPETPIYFVGTGQPAVGYNLNKRMLDEGFYVNIGMFPAVPVKNTGLRFTITNHISKEDIREFVETMVHHYPKALEQESRQLNDVRKAFGLPSLAIESLMKDFSKRPKSLQIEIETSIRKVNRTDWNETFESKGNFDYEGMQLMEEAFSGNELPEENWSFYYLSINDAQGNKVLRTFFTGGLVKDDLISPAEVSMKAEELRMQEPYFLCTNTLIMGSLFTEGEHLYLDRSHPDAEKALKIMMDKIQEIQETDKYNHVIIRDFDPNDDLIAGVMHDSGYFRFRMPNSNQIANFKAKNEEEFFEALSARSRRHLRNDVHKKRELFTIQTVSQLSKYELQKAYELYLNIARRNKSINIFAYPFSLFERMNATQNWEFIKLYIMAGNQPELVGVGCCYLKKNTYNAVLAGLDYRYNENFGVYKQLMYQVCLRAIEVKAETINLGLSADVEKKKLGAQQLQKSGFFSFEDNFHVELLDKLG